MLSIDDVKNVSFRRANFGGYRSEDVDAFVDDVELSYSELLAEKKRLLFEIDHLNKRIEKLYCEGICVIHDSNKRHFFSVSFYINAGTG